MLEGTDRTGQAVLQQLRVSRQDAIERVFRTLYARHPELELRFGQRGKDACIEDLNFNYDYLEATIESQSPAYFAQYILWVRRLLESRNVPSSSLKESLELMGAFFQERLEPVHAVVVQGVLDAGLEVFASPEAGALVYPFLPDTPVDIGLVVDQLVKGDRRGVQGVVDGLLQEGKGYVDVAVSVIQPALYEVGELWHARRITVAQEHLATTVSQYVLTNAFAQASFSEPVDRRVLLACVQGNHHALGLRMLGDTLETVGWQVQFLGANVPTRDLLEQVDAWRPEMLALSVSMPQQLGALRGVIERVRVEMGAQAPGLMVGGLPTNQIERLWSLVGADLWSPDARSAVQELN